MLFVSPQARKQRQCKNWGLWRIRQDPESTGLSHNNQWLPRGIKGPSKHPSFSLLPQGDPRQTWTHSTCGVLVRGHTKSGRIAWVKPSCCKITFHCHQALCWLLILSYTTGSFPLSPSYLGNLFFSYTFQNQRSFWRPDRIILFSCYFM